MPQGVECSFAVASDGCKFYSTFTKTMSTKIFQSYIYKKSTHLYSHIHIHMYTHMSEPGRVFHLRFISPVSAGHKIYSRT